MSISVYDWQTHDRTNLADKVRRLTAENRKVNEDKAALEERLITLTRIHEQDIARLCEEKDALSRSIRWEIWEKARVFFLSVGFQGDLEFGPEPAIPDKVTLKEKILFHNLLRLYRLLKPSISKRGASKGKAMPKAIRMRPSG